MKINFKDKDIYKYTCAVTSLTLAFWFISVFEVFMSKTLEGNLFINLIFKFINDFWAGLVIGVLILPVYFLIHLCSKKAALISVLLIFTLLVIVEFALVKYSLTTLLNLGADLLGYSFADIYSTVSASEAISFVYFLPFVISVLLFFSVYKLVIKKGSKNVFIVVGIVLIVAFGILKLICPNVSKPKNQNKICYLSQDIFKFQSEKKKLNAFNNSGRNDYPLLKSFTESKDVLSPYFNIKEEKPNVVVLIVEGLGSEFMGGKTYSGFTPYLDGLISKSLYWDNFLSNTGRTFGVLPSLLGSLPFGETGFLELPKTPSHISLISVLKSNGYTTSYFSGDQSSFDKKVNFLEYNDIDNIIDENKYGPEYVKTQANSGGFSWGYPDSEIFKKTLASLDDTGKPRLDIIMTLSNHEPFVFPSKELYEQKVDSILNTNQRLQVSKEDVEDNKDIFTALYYTDHSIKNFMEGYAKREDFKNTIFIITGDHRLIPISQKDKLCRFHVPLYIYSPMLKKAEKFKSVSSHWDVAPSLLSFLMNNYKFNKLEKTAWMSEGLDTAKQFRNIHKIPLMRYKGSVNDFMFKDYLYSDNELYKVNENFGIYKVSEESIKKTMADSLMAFKKMNAYVSKRDKIYPDSLNIYIKPSVEFSEEQWVSLKTMTHELSFDETFQLARQKAFNKEREVARLLCDYILNELPNHSDARTLKGRTLAWDGDYLKAEMELLSVIKRSPFYYDSYLALLDLYWWTDQDKKSEPIYKQVLANKIVNSEISFKMAKAFNRLKDKKAAIKLMDSIIKIYPENKAYLEFKATLK